MITKLTVLPIILMLFFAGCQNITIKTTHSWESHYLSVEQFKQGTKDISLNEDESIWVISNSTLEHILRTR